MVHTATKKLNNNTQPLKANTSTEFALKPQTFIMKYIHERTCRPLKTHPCVKFWRTCIRKIFVCTWKNLCLKYLGGTQFRQNLSFLSIKRDEFAIKRNILTVPCGFITVLTHHVHFPSQTCCLDDFFNIFMLSRESWMLQFK